MKNIWFITSLSFTVSVLFLFLRESGVLKSTTNIVWGAMCALSFSNVFFFFFFLQMLVALHLGHRRLELRVHLFLLMRMKLSFLIAYGWKSILLDIRMATPACFLGPFAWKTFPALYSEIVSVWMLRCAAEGCSCLCIQSVSFYWAIESIDVKRY